MSLEDDKSRTELDYHANMVLIGHHALLINNLGQTAEVITFTLDYEALRQVPIVDVKV